jgi:tRNA 2-thiouridine synthesizing protein A
MTAEGLRDHLWAHFQRRACYGEVWRRVNEREGFSRAGLPACLWPDSGGTGVGELFAQATEDSAPASLPPVAISIADFWDAGEMACGDLVLELRLRMDRLDSGAMLKLVARDPGAKEDLPAWCRLTGHKLRAQSPPEYWIQRKE